MKSRHKSGSMLLDLVIAILLIAIIALIAIPFFMNRINDAHETRAQLSITETMTVAKIIFTENNQLPAQANLLQKLNELGGISYVNYPDQVTTGPDVVSIERDGAGLISACAKSDNGVIFCARDSLGPENLEIAAIQSSPNWFETTFNGQAQAYFLHDSVARSACVGHYEPDVRGCLANLAESETGNTNAEPGWDNPPDEQDPSPWQEGKLGDEYLVATGNLDVKGDAQITGSAGAANITIGDSAKICGDIRIGVGSTKPVGENNSNGRGGGLCVGSTIVEENIDPPPVVIPAGLAANNSNARLAGDDPVPGHVWRRGNVDWKPGSRTLTVNHESLTLQGNKPYFLCRLVLTGGAKLITAGAPRTEIFFDKPENCLGVTQPIQIWNGASVINNSPEVPGLFVAGSQSTNTTALFSGGSVVHKMVVYAPRTNITLSGGYRYDGAVIGKNVSISGGGNFNANFNDPNYLLPIVP